MNGPRPLARLFIAAAHKSSGKTTITIGLAAAFSAVGLRVQCFKKGPDYIDPMWLSRAAKRPCYNLDFNTMSPIEIGETFARQSAGCDISLIEANKGLFDGLDPEGADSNAALAKLLGAPVILLIDCEGMTRGIAPLVLGYVAFDQDVAIKGVILNNVGGPRHESKLRAAMQRYTDVPVLGAVARNKELAISERHLGLTTPGEIDVRDDKIKCIGDLVGASVELDTLKVIAQVTLPPVPELSPALVEASTSTLPSLAPVGEHSGAAAAPGASPVRIAIARDEAFGFYYADDLAALADAGTELVPFNTLRDEALPAQIDGLFIGGGFPETHMAALEANTALRGDIKQAIEAGLPSYAECGGLMYLSRSLSWRGNTCDMVGAITGDAVMHERPQGRGYVQLRERAAMPWSGREQEQGQQRSGTQFKAHEFHYASLENLPSDTIFAYDVMRGHGIDGRHDGIVVHNLLANFSHLRDTSANHWAARFVDFIRSQNSEL